MPKCCHKRDQCATCSNCPLCPECTCKGPRRKRGRPSKPVTPNKRPAAAHANKKIQSQATEEEKVDTVQCSSVLELSDTNILHLVGIERQELLARDRRNCAFADLTAVERSTLHRAIKKNLRAVCCMLLPCDTEALYRSFEEDAMNVSSIKGALIDGIRAAKRGSIEKRTLQAICCASLPQNEVIGMLSNDQMDGKPMDNESQNEMESNHAGLDSESTDSVAGIFGIKNECHVQGCLQRKDGYYKTATGHNCAVCSNSVHLLFCERIIGIQVVDEDTPLYCTSCAISKGIINANRQNASRKEHSSSSKVAETMNAEKSNKIHTTKRSGFQGRIYQVSRKEWNYLLCNSELPERKYSKKRRDDNEIRFVLQFLFQSHNVQLLSWGTKRVRVDEKWVPFPSVLRRKTSEKLFRDYVDALQASNANGKPLSRSAFLKITETLTRGQINRKAAVDYVLGTLVYDNLRLLRQIVSNEISDQQQAKMLLSQLDAVEEYLKFVMLEHIGTDDDAFHCADFALGTSKHGAEGKESNCNICLSSFQIIDNIKNGLNRSSADVSDVLEDAANKILLYMGHQHRCLNQEKRIAEIFDEVRSDSNVAILLMDYKMKFEPIRFREKTTEFFGKKGISWHGTAVFYKAVHSEGNCESKSDQNGELELVQTLFFDHICSNDMTQECAAVLSILDAAMARLRLELPRISKVYILSDNAKCYQNDLLPVMAAFISREHSLALTSIVHSETQRGKSLIDAHFALAMMHINRYCRETTNDVVTPGDIVMALNSNGGIANCTAEMIYINKKHSELSKWIEAKRNSAICRLGRMNEIAYSAWDNDVLTATCFALSNRNSTKFVFGRRTSKSVVPEHDVANIDDNDGDDAEMDTDANGSISVDDYRRPSDVLYTGRLTGILVWSRARLRRQLKRRRTLRIQNNDMDAVTSCLEEQRDKVIYHHNDENQAAQGQVVAMQCDKCGKNYSRYDFWQAHVSSCSGENGSQTILSRACRMAFDMLKNSELLLYTTTLKAPAALSIEITDNVRKGISLREGWAQRPAYGKTLGSNTVQTFAKDIEGFFQAGEEDKGKKMSAVMMRNALLQRYPRRYDIPGEHFIGNYISSMVRKRKKAVNQLGNADQTAGRRSSMPSRYREALDTIVMTVTDLMPRHGRSVLIEHLEIDNDNLPADFPEDKTIRARISYIRNKRNRLVGQSEHGS